MSSCGRTARSLDHSTRRGAETVSGGQEATINRSRPWERMPFEHFTEVCGGALELSRALLENIRIIGAKSQRKNSFR